MQYKGVRPHLYTGWPLSASFSTAPWPGALEASSLCYLLRMFTAEGSTRLQTQHVYEM